MLSEIQALGCSEKAAKLYLTALKRGRASISELAKAAGIKRPTAYLLMDDLLARGFMRTAPYGRRIVYQAIAPEAIFATQEEERLKLRHALPDLQKLFAAKNIKTRVVHFEGKTAMNRAYEEMLRARDIWSLFSPEQYQLLFNHDDNKHHIRVLVRGGGRLHDMIPDTPASREFAQASYRMPNCETRLLPARTHIDSEIAVFDDNVMHMSFATATATVITDPTLATTLRAVLKILWQQLKPL